MDVQARAANVLKRQQLEKRKINEAKDIRDNIIKQAVARLNAARDDNGGRLPHKKMKKVIEALATFGVKVTRFTLNRTMEKQSRRPLSTILVANLENTTEVSSLGLHGVEGDENLSTINDGRPVGTTKVNIAKMNSKKAACITSIATKYQCKFEEGKRKFTIVPRGYLDDLIIAEKHQYGLPQDFYISRETILSRSKRKNPATAVTASPIEGAEESLVQICITMGNVRQPLTPTEGIQLMNSLIKDRDLQKDLIEYKKRRRNLGQGLYPERLGEVGRGYWTGFMRRQSHRLVTKRGERFASNRADWSKFSYIKQMYDVIYDEYVDAGVAKPRAVSVFMDRAGNICDEESKFGEPCDIEITHPEYILFGDETGCNTSQKKDGHAAGTKYVVAVGQVPKTSCVTTDHRFTLLPITSGSAGPVLCVAIFQGKGSQVPAIWTSGIDITITPVRDSDGNIAKDESNFGSGKYFPGGPSCTYNGKEIPCATYITEGGGINADILVDVLKMLDKLDVFPRVPGGPVPFLILDGHESRLDPKFLTYINDVGHIWKVCLGVPYATSYWQVGDSAEQNGAFKVLWYKAKKRLVSYKRDRGMPMVLNAEDIIPLLNGIWADSFGRVRTNKQATSDRGWNPPNRKLQSHPDLLPNSDSTTGPSEPSQQTNSEPTSSSSVEPVDLNLDEGFSTVVLDRIIQHRLRNGGTERRKERLQEGNAAAAALAEAKKITAGIMVGVGIHSLNNAAFLAAILAVMDRKAEKLRKEAQKARREMRARIEKVVKIRETKGRGEEQGFSSWTADNCKDYLQYKKDKTDPAMPTRVALLRARCQVIMGRASPIVSPHASDDEAEEDDAEVATASSSTAAVASRETTLQIMTEEEQMQGLSTIVDVVAPVQDDRILYSEAL